MRQLWFVAIITIVGFAAGAAAGIWYERHRPLPPPPGAVGGEFSGHRKTAYTPPTRPLNRARLASEIERLRPQIEEYKARVDQIDAEFDKGLMGILTADQASRRAERQRRRSARSANEAEDASPLSDVEIMRLMQGPSFQMLRTLVVNMRLHELTGELGLDAGQQDKVRDLLRHRRDEMIALVDSVPPPSIMLLNLAPYVQRLNPPKAAQH